MGIYTIYDILTDNPGFIDIKHNKKLYEWNNFYFTTIPSNRFYL